MKASNPIISAIVTLVLCLPQTGFAAPNPFRVVPKAVPVPPKITPSVPYIHPKVDVPPRRAEPPPSLPRIAETPHESAPKKESLAHDIASHVGDLIQEAITQSQEAPTQKEKKRKFDEAFVVLRSWHKGLLERRAKLDLGDEKAVRAFNHEAASYHTALHAAQRASAIVPR
jgi:hypothetical protein